MCLRLYTCVCLCSGQPESVYTVFKSLGTELVLGLFLNVGAEEQPELFQEISQLCTQHWHGRGMQINHAHIFYFNFFAALFLDVLSATSFLFKYNTKK